MHLAGATINSRRKGEEGRVKSEERSLKNEEGEFIELSVLIQTGGEETAEGIQFLIILHIGHDPEVAEGYPGTLVVLDHQRAFAMFFVGTAHFPVDPGIVVNEVSVVVHSQSHGLG